MVLSILGLNISSKSLAFHHVTEESVTISEFQSISVTFGANPIGIWNLIRKEFPKFPISISSTENRSQREWNTGTRLKVSRVENDRDWYSKMIVGEQICTHLYNMWWRAWFLDNMWWDWLISQYWINVSVIWI